MNLSSQELREFTQEAYDLTRASVGVDEGGVGGPALDMSSSNLCSFLTTNFQALMTETGLTTRRELHMTRNGVWHFVVAHANPDASPSEDDLISDLNPWQFMPERPVIGALHGTRAAVEKRLQLEGAPDWFISLRGLSTIRELHTDVRKPTRHQRRAA
jgi:hypothetical protein